MILSPKQYTFNFTPNKVLVQTFIKSNHYLHSCPSIIYCFTLEYQGNIIGACIFSTPSRQNITVPGCYEILELSRLFIIDETPKNTESYFIGKCLNWLKNNTKYEAVVSFADTTEGHTGVIYKASNFKLLGTTTPNYHYEDNNGNRIHKRQVWDRAKKNHKKESEQANKENLKLITEFPKNKYVYYLKDLVNINIIYGLLHPITKELKYIGKSEQGINRWKEHIKPSALKQNCPKTNWIKSLLINDLLPDFIILEKCSEASQLFDAEQFWIEYYKGLGCNLTNLTVGGDGTTGYKHSSETIIKLKNIKKAKGRIPHNKKEIFLIDNVEHKECAKCLEIKVIYKNKNRYDSYCRDCRNIIQKQWKEKNPSPILPEDEYNKTRLPGAIAGGEVSKRPERRKQTSERLSKAIIGEHVVTQEIVQFKSAFEAKKAGFQNSNIGQAIKYKKPYKNYRWKFNN